MRYILDIEFIFVFFKLVVVCGSYCVVVDVPINKENCAKIYSFISDLGGA
jgi:hypothetical protein